MILSHSKDIDYSYLGILLKNIIYSYNVENCYENYGIARGYSLALVGRKISVKERAIYVGLVDNVFKQRESWLRMNEFFASSYGGFK